MVNREEVNPMGYIWWRHHLVDDDYDDVVNGEPAARCHGSGSATAHPMTRYSSACVVDDSLCGLTKDTSNCSRGTRLNVRSVIVITNRRAVDELSTMLDFIVSRRGSCETASHVMSIYVSRYGCVNIVPELILTRHTLIPIATRNDEHTTVVVVRRNG